MSKKKEISQSTIIELKLQHIVGFFASLVTILVVIFSFFFGMLNNNIEEKVDSKVYIIEKKYLDEKFEGLSKLLDETKSEGVSTNKTVQIISIDVAEIKAKNNNTGRFNSINSTPGTNIPNGLGF